MDLGELSKRERELRELKLDKKEANVLKKWKK